MAMGCVKSTAQQLPCLQTPRFCPRERARAARRPRVQHLNSPAGVGGMKALATARQKGTIARTLWTCQSTISHPDTHAQLLKQPAVFSAARPCAHLPLCMEPGGSTNKRRKERQRSETEIPSPSASTCPPTPSLSSSFVQCHAHPTMTLRWPPSAPLPRGRQEGR